jgi:SAM-dependent methyltransferase
LPPIDEVDLDLADPLSAGDGGPRIVVDPVWGYRRLDPLPSSPELDEFYESHYRDLLDDGGRAPDLARLVTGGSDATIERAWQAATLHADVLAALELAAHEGLPRRALDVGCGTGELLRTLVAGGWDATGTEPAPAIAEVGRATGLQVEAATASAYLARWRADGRPLFSGILLMNVLEHIPDPAALLTELVTALAPGGRLIVRVPNDFNPLQAAAHRALGGRRWWVAIPDHVNYFDLDSIAGLLARIGLEVIDRSADFPMELFLLMGDDYVADRELGPVCHARRQRLELSMDPEARRAFGRAMVPLGWGRNSVIVARVRP